MFIAIYFDEKMDIPSFYGIQIGVLALTLRYVLPPCGFSASDMAFRFVFQHNFTDFFRQFFIYSGKAFGHILVDSTLTNTENIGSLPYGCRSPNYVLTHLHRSLANVVLHRFPPSLFLMCIRPGSGVFIKAPRRTVKKWVVRYS
jgi:hypothetical protein